MTDILYKYKKLFEKNKNLILFFIFLSLGLASTLFVEYKYQYAQFRWLGWRIILAAAAVFKFGSIKRKKRKNRIIIKLLVFFVIIYLINLSFNLINIYHLERFPEINEFCAQNQHTCEYIVSNFFRYKAYRFVSLTPYFFFYVIFLLVGLLYSEAIYKRANKIWGKIPKFKVKYLWLFYFFMAYLLFQQLVFTFSLISKKVVKLVSTVSLPFEERWEPVMGGRHSFGWIDTYSNFINSQVEEDKKILIPNQEAPWEMEGNPHYIRWFFYPRRTVQMNEETEIPKEADYALITYGIFGFHKKTFPDFEINKDKISKIILIDRETLETNIIENQDFIPEDYQDKWGIIKLKSEK